MKNCLAGLFLLLATSAMAAQKVTPEECLYLNDGVAANMIRYMAHDLNIPGSSIVAEKTKLTLLSVTPVDEKLAETYAKKYLQTFTDEVKGASLTEAKQIYLKDHVKNLLIQYEFENKSHKKNIFIGSELINDHECSVAFQGYLIVKREF